MKSISLDQSQFSNSALYTCLLLSLCHVGFIFSSNEGISYQLLSERSKKRLDTLRQLAIERLLVNYSMVSIYGMNLRYASLTSIIVHSQMIHG